MASLRFGEGCNSDLCTRLGPLVVGAVNCTDVKRCYVMLNTLTPKQRKAAQLQAEGGSARDASKAVGVHEVTLARWRTLPAYQDHLRGLIEQSESEVIDMLHGLKRRATQRLGELLESNSPSVALKAAEAILDRTKGHYTDNNAQDPLQGPLDMLLRTLPPVR